MANDNVVRLITIRGKAEGIDETTSALKKLVDAQGNVVTVSEKQSKATSDLDKMTEQYRRRLEDGYRQNQQFNKVQSDLTMLKNAGRISGDQYNSMLEKEALRLGQSSTFAKAFREALGGVQNQIVALSAGAGPVGVFLSGLGPIGLAAAVGLGALTNVFGSLRQLASDMGDKARNLRDFAETTGLTITQLKGLEKAGRSVGVENEQTVAFMERFSVGVLDLKRGTGSLYDELLRINPELVKQMQLSRGMADAYNIWARAVANATNEEERNKLARAAGGRGGIPNSRTAMAVAGAGGIDSLPGGAGGTEAQIRLWAELQQKIKETDAATRNIWGQAWSTEILQAELMFSQTLKAIAETASTFSPSQAFMKMMSVFANGPAAMGSSLASVAWNYLSGGGKPMRVDVPPTPGGPQIYSSPIGPQRPAGYRTPEAIAKEWSEKMSVLGSAATLTEQLEEKQAALNARLTETGHKYDYLSERANAALRAQKEAAEIQIRISAGIATVEQLRAQKEGELDQQLQKLGISETRRKVIIEQNTQATQKYIEEVERRMAVERAALPGLKSLELETANVRNQADQFGVNSLNNLTTGLADITMGTKTAGQGFRDLGNVVLRALEEMLIKMTIVRGMAMALQAAFGIFGGGIGSMPNLPGSGPFPKFAGGTDFAPGGPAIVGENGPEIVNLRRGSSVTPGVFSGASANVHVNVNVENRNGSNVDVKSTRNSSGGVDLQVMVDHAVSAGLASGKHDGAMRARYGTQVQSRGR